MSRSRLLTGLPVGRVQFNLAMGLAGGRQTGLTARERPGAIGGEDV